MRKFLIILTLAVILFCISAQHAQAMLGLLTEKFAQRPYSKIVINGKELLTRLTPLAQNSRLIEWLDEKQKSSLYWVEKVNKDGRLVWQGSPSELATFEYTYDKDEQPHNVLIRIILPELKNFAFTPHFTLCRPSERQNCYMFQEVATHILVTAKRDDNKKIISGTMKSTFFTQDGKTFTKEQQIRVSYPNENVMRIEFEGFGEPWAYPDAWQEYRIENGGLVWEICRTFGAHTCKKD